MASDGAQSQVAAEVVRALRTYRSRTAQLEAVIAGVAGLSLSDMRCVDLLDFHGGRMTAGELARAATLTTGAITGVIDRLERAGVARRVPDEADRRRVLVELDEAGRERGRRSYAAIVDAERAHLRALDEGQLAVLRDFLTAEASWVQQVAARLRAREGS